MLRIAALVDTRYFPPVINSHNNISVADKISRSLAFMVSQSAVFVRLYLVVCY